MLLELKGVLHVMITEQFLTVQCQSYFYGSALQIS